MSDIQKLKELIASRPALQKNKNKKVFQTERIRYQMEIGIYTKECRILEMVTVSGNMCQFFCC